MSAPSLRLFYEEVMTMAREGVPAPVIAEKIRRAVPDPPSRRQLLGHLRDSRDAFEREGREGPAALLEAVITSLEGPDGP